MFEFLQENDLAAIITVITGALFLFAIVIVPQLLQHKSEEEHHDF